MADDRRTDSSDTVGSEFYDFDVSRSLPAQFRREKSLVIRRMLADSSDPSRQMVPVEPSSWCHAPGLLPGRALFFAGENYQTKLAAVEARLPRRHAPGCRGECGSGIDDRSCGRRRLQRPEGPLGGTHPLPPLLKTARHPDAGEEGRTFRVGNPGISAGGRGASGRQLSSGCRVTAPVESGRAGAAAILALRCEIWPCIAVQGHVSLILLFLSAQRVFSSR